jgi:hypothetical protein
MPSSSKKQAKTMRAAAHNPGLAKKLGIPKKVARDFVTADQKSEPGGFKPFTKKRK